MSKAKLFFIKMRRSSRHYVSLGYGKSILQLKTKYKTFFAKERKRVLLISLNAAHTKSDGSPRPPQEWRKKQRAGVQRFLFSRPRPVKSAAQVLVLSRALGGSVSRQRSGVREHQPLR